MISKPVAITNDKTKLNIRSELKALTRVASQKQKIAPEAKVDPSGRPLFLSPLILID